MAEDRPSRLRVLYDVLLLSGKQYGVDRVSRMSAALSYRTFFAAAPMLFFAVAIFGRVLGSESEAKQTIYDAVFELGGKEIADAVDLILDSVVQSTGSAAIIGAILLLWTASTLFLELQNNLNDIFGVPYEHTAGMIAFIRKRGIGFLWVLGLGVALVAIWLVNFAWRFFEGLFPDDLVGVHTLIGYLAPVVSLFLFPILIALVFRTMVLKRVRWRALWYGSIFISVTVLIATYVMGLYFAWDDGTSATAVVGSIFVILLLAYTIASVFLFGAIVTRVYADYLEYGDLMQPSERERLLLEQEIEEVIEDELEQELVLEMDVPATDGGEKTTTAAVLGFLGGLVVGWRGSRK